MRSWSRFLLIAGVFVATSAVLPAQQSLRDELKDNDIAPHWIYDDLPKVLAQVRETGKPVLLVLRCVPCPPGKTLDSQLMQPNAEIEKLEKNFVCVRVIQTKGLDLKRYQYDYDQSWAAMFLNGDGTIYGRFGTRAGRGPESDRYLTLSAFRKAAERCWRCTATTPATARRCRRRWARTRTTRCPRRSPG